MDCNLGSEIGQKMRSAVKAKLLELGTGGSSGFIDDELPDYVMVMVANKRTKAQMNAELNLFLGDQTDLFVTWLHEVLQKLQEVTLPASSATSKKRKSRQAETPKGKDKDKDKDKKSRDKRDKRAHRKSGEDHLHTSVEGQTRSVDAVPIISSITDVFAEELLEKAKKTLEVDAHLKDELLLQKKKKRKAVDEPTAQEKAQEQETTKKDFDIPTMSEISSTTTTGCGNREKDMAELAEIQRKIYAAKQHLRQIGELDDESEDEEMEEQNERNEQEDVLNLNEQDETVTISKEPTPVAAAAGAAINLNSSCSTRKVKSPIVFNRTSETAAREKPKPENAEFPLERQQKSIEERLDRLERRSVHQRLGSKPQQQQPQTPPERPQRAQKELELYVPAHRRRSEVQLADIKRLERGRERSQRNESQPERRRERERERDRERERERERERDRDTVRSRRTKSLSPDPSPEANYKHRIGSRVIVANNKPPEPSDDEDLLEKPVNSVIKIKPRPLVSPRRQACKNLLLRAVADAQRSTILAKTPATSATAAAAAAASKQRANDEPELISSTLGKRRTIQSVGVAVAGKELFRHSRRELLLNVVNRDDKRKRLAVKSQVEPKLTKKQVNETKERVLEEDEEEYVPSLSIGAYEAYVPQLVHDMDIDMHVEKTVSISGTGAAGVSKTQFVVTLNGDKSQTLGNAAAFRSGKRSRKRTPSPQVSSTSSTLQTVQLLSAEPTSTTCSSSTSNNNNNNNNRRNKAKRARSSSRSSPSTSSNTPPSKPSRSVLRSEVLRQPPEIKKIIIKHDANADDDEDEMQLQASPHKRTSIKRLSSSSNIAASSSSSGSNERKIDSKVQPKDVNRSTTPPLPPKRPDNHDISIEKSSSSRAAPAAATTEATAATLEAPAKVKHTPIRFKIKPDEEQLKQQKKRHSPSKERDSSVERRRISIRNAEDKKYDNLPTLSAVSVDSAVLKVAKPKERCKYHPNCSKQFCEYYHPTAPCKSFPNCKFADKCMYSHPKCKFDLICMSVDCNFSHSGQRDLSHAQLAAPPLSSHVIPVQNYKSISAPVTASTATIMCKYYPNCTKVGCMFYHPKLCRYGQNCINKLECIFYHPEMQSKFKWVASMG